jgi:hypothetical protein
MDREGRSDDCLLYRDVGWRRYHADLGLPIFEALNMRPQEFAVTMAMDAFRIAIGVRTRTHQPAEVIRWLAMMAAQEKEETDEKGMVDR